MEKDEIRQTILKLHNNEEIEQFIKQRIEELEELSAETTVGQNHTDSFREYISKKTHYKAAMNFGNTECPDLIYDDITPYRMLVEMINNKWYDEMTLFTDIFFVIDRYLPSNYDDGVRQCTYWNNVGNQLSIQTIRENKCAFCSEKAGMAHNLFKFLGIDSEVICGFRNNEPHAYNFVYPNGYGNEPMVLYDPSFFVNFTNQNETNSFGFFKIFRKEEYGLLKEGMPINVDLNKTEEKYRRKYSISNDYVFEPIESTYIFGLGNAGKFGQSSSSLHK